MTKRLAAWLVVGAVGVGACNGTSNNSDAAMHTGDAGGPVPGMANTHCAGEAGMIVTTVDPSACTPADAGAPVDAGTVSPSDPGYGDTNYGTTAYDDDCKYNVTYSVTPIYENSNVTFTVSATALAGGAPVHGAAVRAEVFLSDTHPAPNTAQTVTENPSGTYTVGPVQFDASGQWTVRFHFFEDCDDSPTSPHGHAAFYLNVP